MKDNIMRTVKIERIVLNIGGTEGKLDKGKILLERLSGEKPIKVKAVKRIPTWKVSPGLPVGIKVTLRGKKAEELLQLLLEGANNTLKEKQIQENFVSFGIKEYIEIPGVEYIREVGIIGLEVTAVFSRAGKRVGLKKAKRGKVRRQKVSKEEIIEIMENKFKTKIIRRKK